MAVKLITNGAINGALAGMAAGRQKTVAAALVPADATFASWALQAKAVGTAVATANAALTTPMADADNTEIGQLVFAAAFAMCYGDVPGSTVATDAQIVALAIEIVQIAKQTVPQLV